MGYAYFKLPIWVTNHELDNLFTIELGFLMCVCKVLPKGKMSQTLNLGLLACLRFEYAYETEVSLSKEHYAFSIPGAMA